MAEKATSIYQRHTSWQSEYCRKNALLVYRYIRPLKHPVADISGPCVMLCSPGMLHSGQSLEVFKAWAPDPRNMLIIPGYCAAGTVGARVLSGTRHFTFADGSTAKEVPVEVAMEVANLSFSAHVDSKGICQLVEVMQPAAVVLVHGERAKMGILRDRIHGQMGIPCFAPANGEGLRMRLQGDVKENDNVIEDALQSLQ